MGTVKDKDPAVRHQYLNFPSAHKPSLATTFIAIFEIEKIITYKGFQIRDMKVSEEQTKLA